MDDFTEDSVTFMSQEHNARDDNKTVSCQIYSVYSLQSLGNAIVESDSEITGDNGCISAFWYR